MLRLVLTCWSFVVVFLSGCHRPNFGGKLHLSFDVEGSPPEALWAVLDTLDQYQAPASFFVRGDALAKWPDQGRGLLTAIRERGHLLGNHSFSHPYFTKLSAEAIATELQATDLLLQDFITVRLMRPPFAADDDRVREIIRELGYIQVKWDVQAAEYEGWDDAYVRGEAGSRERFLRYLVAKVQKKNGGILNVHDCRLVTENLALILGEFQQHGFHFVPLEYFLAPRSAL